MSVACALECVCVLCARMSAILMLWPVGRSFFFFFFGAGWHEEAATDLSLAQTTVPGKPVLRLDLRKVREFFRAVVIHCFVEGHDR